MNDSLGNDVNNAYVTAYNVCGALIENLATGSDGWTVRSSLVDYVNYDGTRKFYSNYTINGTNVTLSSSDHVLNVSYEMNVVDYLSFVERSQ